MFSDILKALNFAQVAITMLGMLGLQGRTLRAHMTLACQDI
ncbi:hypothetical protein RR48_01925 [Papilio machaon]|uniref:Uncharacterized protein n=1 Tax=Papilio machaon TaxID=76193 RepID=A0A0N1IIH5_PAPMA|nr:hypothetical protein RR48_01925 [Papilio machaon]